MSVEEQGGYTGRFVAFVDAHLAEYQSAWLSPGASTRAILERLSLEFYNLKHSRPACMCWCYGQRHDACERWRIAVGGYGHAGGVDVGVEIGRTAAVHAPMPSVELLDFARASDPRLRLRSMGDRVRFLNGELAA